VSGTGPLIVNKIIQIAMLLGLYPFQFLLQSRIAKSTCTYKYICREFGLDDVNTDSPRRTLFHDTNQSPNGGGNVLQGSTKEHNKLEKKGVWESIYDGMNILLPELEEKGYSTGKSNNRPSRSLLEVRGWAWGCRPWLDQ
jgi:hypothetical protein